MERATRIAFSGRLSRDGAWSRPVSWRIRRLARSSRSWRRSRRNGSVCRNMRARVSDWTRPTAVIGEHAVGFEHLAMLAALDNIAMFQHLVEIGLQRLDGGFEVLQFLRHIVGDEIGDDDARLVQHDMAERDAFA